MKGLTTEVAVARKIASYNRNVIISSHISLNLLNSKAEGRANETFDALPGRYHGATNARSHRGFGTISLHK